MLLLLNDIVTVAKSETVVNTEKGVVNILSFQLYIYNIKYIYGYANKKFFYLQMKLTIKTSFST